MRQFYLTLSLLICSISLTAQLRLNVEGDARIDGRLEINSGGSNLFIGNSAGLANTSGDQNTFLGTNAGLDNESGTANTFLGAWAGTSNIDGYDNVFVGKQAGSTNTSGRYNTFLGSFSGPFSSSGSENTFVGNAAANLNDTGFRNTFMGRLAGAVNTTGSYNTVLGAYADVASENLTYATAIGANAEVGCSNCLVLGNSVNVGIGTSNPGARLEVVGPRIRLISPSNAGKLLELRSDGNALDISATGGQLFLTGNDGAGVMLQQFNGNVGIGNDTSPDFKLEVVGSAGKSGGGMWSDTSDKRLKKDIEDFEDGLEEVLRIRPVWYRFNGKFGLPDSDRYVGVIAQEIQEIAPYTVTPYTETDPDSGESGEYLSYNGTAVVYMLVNATQEQQALIERQEKENQAHERKIAQLQTEVTELRALVEQLLAGQNQTPDPGSKKEPKLQTRLSQNFPNPFHEDTQIGYYLPAGTSGAQLDIFTLDGKLVESMALTQTGAGQVTIKAGRLPAGTYLYSLVLGKEVLDTKRMVLTR